jgi:multimeric flavodoxin WrbA
MALTALAFNCTLKSASGEISSTERLLEDVVEALRAHGVGTEVLRAVDHPIRPGVTADEGEGDAWPALRQRLLETDIVVIGTPIWLGQPSSVCKRVLERMDAFLADTDEQGRMRTYGKVAMVAVVGNEDGAHHVSAELYQALNDVGFSLAPNAVTYWVGEAMHGTDLKDLDTTPDPTANATAMMVRNGVHLARLLVGNAYPPSD